MSAPMPSPARLVAGDALRVIVSVDGWSCMAGPSPLEDEYGNIHVLQTLEGWFGGVDIRASSASRSMMDGDFDGYAPRAARTVTVTGTMVCHDVPALLAGMDRLTGVLGRSERRGWLNVAEEARGYSRGMLARLAGATTVERLGRVAATYSMSFYSPDPNRYGDVVFGSTVLGGAQTIDALNIGNIGTFPVVTFAGPVVNPVLTSAYGDALKLLMTINDGDTVEIDCATRAVWLTSAGDPLRSSRRYLMAFDSTWLRVPPGTTRYTFTSDDVVQLGACRLEWRGAWS